MDIPDRWLKALASVQKTFPEAIIAGGALRDLDNGAPVKDIDIFVKHRGEDTLSLLGAALGIVGIDETLADPAYQVDNPEVVGVYGFYDGEDHPIQVIACGDRGDDFTLHQLDRFDIGLCRIAYDGKILITTAEYDADKERRELCIYRTHNTQRSYERAHRISQKYPGWKIVGPNGESVVSGV